MASQEVSESEVHLNFFKYSHHFLNKRKAVFNLQDSNLLQLRLHHQTHVIEPRIDFARIQITTLGQILCNRKPT